MSAYRAKPFWIHVQRRLGFTFSNLGFTVQRFESKAVKNESKTVKLCTIRILTAVRQFRTVPNDPGFPPW